mmetsp:Transcript_17414/g.51964  ORF Transcript_17414/g.51964 Transcript_17414/m.51964 type:complete len:392 (-) Transcript_17414:2717-3892(-)
MPCASWLLGSGSTSSSFTSKRCRSCSQFFTGTRWLCCFLHGTRSCSRLSTFGGRATPSSEYRIALPSGVPTKTDPLCFEKRCLLPGLSTEVSSLACESVMAKGKYDTSISAFFRAGTTTSRGHEKKFVPAGLSVITCGTNFQSTSCVFSTSKLFLTSLRTSVLNSSVLVSPVRSTQQPMASSVKGAKPSSTQRMSFTLIRTFKGPGASAGGAFPRRTAAARSAFLYSSTRSRVGWKATVSAMSSWGRTKPSDGETEKILPNRAGNSNLNFAPKSPKLDSRTRLVTSEPTTTSPKNTECSLKRISVAWHVPSTVNNLTSRPPSQRARSGTLKGDTRVKGVNRSSTSSVSRGRNVVGWAGDQKIDLFVNSSWSSPSWNVTGRADRFTKRTVLL